MAGHVPCWTRYGSDVACHPVRAMLKMALFFGQWSIVRGQNVAFCGLRFVQRALQVAHEGWCISGDPLEVTVSRCGTATASQKVTFGHASIAA